jgi:hypothetical protein
VFVGGPQEGARLVTDVGQEIEADDADPAGGEGRVELFSDELAHLGLVGALHVQHVLDDAGRPVLHLVGHVRVADDQPVQLVQVLFEFLHILLNECRQDKAKIRIIQRSLLVFVVVAGLIHNL